MKRGGSVKAHIGTQPERDGSIPSIRSRFVIRPCELKDANAYIERYHRHHKRVVGHRFSIGYWIDDVALVGVAVVGRPVARAVDQRRVVEVARLCTNGHANACSALYAAAARASKEIGYDRIQTYILESEPATSLKAAGWVFEQIVIGRDWNAPSRGGRRTDQPMCNKARWAKQLREER